ncbi:CsbD family protein [Planctomonas psychrotolerans]|uniref:CsbD family protein n=1 Tax=Planctomonas psychrotolerans TaxID=2528712 RepID=UPI00123992C2|nr:CsbD family protein [Planctomonas psychrotolerans]
MGLDDKIKNAAQDVAGKVKEATGEHKNDPDLKAEGQKDQSASSVKQAGENIKDAFK